MLTPICHWKVWKNFLCHEREVDVRIGVKDFAGNSDWFLCTPAHSRDTQTEFLKRENGDILTIFWVSLLMSGLDEWSRSRLSRQVVSMVSMSGLNGLDCLIGLTYGLTC